MIAAATLSHHLCRTDQQRLEKGTMIVIVPLPALYHCISDTAA